MLGIMERELFLQAIKLARGNQVQAARWLGISLPYATASAPQLWFRDTNCKRYKFHI